MPFVAWPGSRCALAAASVRCRWAAPDWPTRDGPCGRAASWRTSPGPPSARG